MEIRRLTRADAASFKALRMEMLASHPNDFLETVEETEARTLADFESVMETCGIFGLFAGGTLSGSACYYAPAQKRKQHLGCLWGMYVRENMRGQGIAVRLLMSVIEFSRQQGKLYLLCGVSASNERAYRFYLRMGFQAYAHDPVSMMVGGHLIPENQLYLKL